MDCCFINKKIVICVLIVSLLLSPVSILMVEANESEIYYLQSSKVMNENGEWVTGGGGFSCNNGTYNCYAYAISRFELGKYYPYNFLDQYQPGGIYPEKTNHPTNNSLVEIRDNVLLDLEALGYTDIQVYDDVNDIPSTLNYSTHELICFRLGTHNDNTHETDYHFMKYDNETQSWYHKPGTTAILKYTANNGIPANDVLWKSETIDAYGNATVSDTTYIDDIWYVVYNKLRLVVSQREGLEQNVSIKGGQTNSGKDAFYEIVVPESGCYTIKIETPTVEIGNANVIANFNYEIYSYNMYNGDYIVTSGRGQSGSTFSETINLTAYDDYNDGSEDWKYQAYKHYIRLDFERMNTSDVSVNVSITHTHDYTDHYVSSSSTQHTVYCWCGEHELQDHVYNYVITDSHHTKVCACGAVGLESEEHYRSYCVSKNQDLHYVYCECGHLIEEDTHDMVPTSKLNMSACRDCGYLRNDSNTGAVIKGEKNNPEAETE